VKLIKSFLYYGNFIIENAVGGVISSICFDICYSFNTFSVVIEVSVFSL